MKPAIIFRLSVMMFLQYAVWGAWLPIVARFLKANTAEGGLGFSDTQIGWILGLASIGAVSAPFVAGQFADRYFRTERFLGCLLALGGIVITLLSYQTSYTAWLLLITVYSILFVPTLALSNSLAFYHIDDADRDFPKVRVWGTIGWIAASWAFPMIWLQTGLKLGWMPPFLVGSEIDGVTASLVSALRFSGIISFVYAAYCLALPATPPKRDAVEQLAFRKAFKLFTRPSCAVLVLASLAVASIHQIYFLQTSPFFASLGIMDSQIGPAMTIGQFSEIVMMVILGLMLKRIGFKWVMFIGCTAYLARYAVWGTASLPTWVMVVSQVLHGLCYSCFFATSFIYVDRIADEDVRHSAQTVYGIIILGAGPVLGGQLSGWLGTVYTPEGGQLDYSSFWYAVAAMGLVTSVLFALLFRDETMRAPASDVASAES